MVSSNNEHFLISIKALPYDFYGTKGKNNKTKVTALIDNVRTASQQENAEVLERAVNELKVAMKEVVEAPKPIVNDDAAPFIDLNDL